MIIHPVHGDVHFTLDKAGVVTIDQNESADAIISLSQTNIDQGLSKAEAENWAINNFMAGIANKIAQSQKAAAATKANVDPISFDNETPNTIETPYGPVTFLADEQGEVTLVDEADSNAAIDKLAADKNKDRNRAGNILAASIKAKIATQLVQQQVPNLPPVADPAPTSLVTKINNTISKVFGSESLFDFSQNQPGKVVRGEFIPDNLGSQIFEAMNKTLKGEVVPTNKAEAAKLFKEYAKVVHPDKNLQSEERQIISEAFFKGMQIAKEQGRVDVLTELKNKFDEEIAALNESVAVAEEVTPSTTQEAPIEEGDVDWNTPVRPGGRRRLYRLAPLNKVDEVTPENWNKLEAFFKKAIPNVPFYRVMNMIRATNGREAYGMLHDGAVYVYEGAEIGTGYHEVFEAIWKMFAGPEEKQAVINEFRNRKGSYKNRVC
jgi:hypothetical protein